MGLRAYELFADCRVVRGFSASGAQKIPGTGLVWGISDKPKLVIVNHSGPYPKP